MVDGFLGGRIRLQTGAAGKLQNAEIFENYLGITLDLMEFSTCIGMIDKNRYFCQKNNFSKK